jgi:hypothetical protein
MDPGEVPSVSRPDVLLVLLMLMEILVPRPAQNDAQASVGPRIAKHQIPSVVQPT